MWIFPKVWWISVLVSVSITEAGFLPEFRRNEMGEDLSTVDDASLMEAIKRAVLDLDEIPLYTIKANTVKREEIPSSIEELPVGDEVFLTPPRRGLYTRSEEIQLGVRSSLPFDDYVLPPEAFQSSRSKRDRSSREAVVELLAVVDNSIYRHALWTYNGDEATALSEIRKYYTVMVTMMNLRFQKFDDRKFHISVRLVGIYVAKDRLSAPWAEYHVKRSRTRPGRLELAPLVALDNFRKWVVERSSELPAHDHAMAFTDYYMVRGRGIPTSGMAYVSTMCMVETGFSTSVVEEHGGFSSLHTAVHELSHSLGAAHDGEGGNSICPAEDNYVMAPSNSQVPSSLKNFFLFSPCTVRQIEAFLSTERADCVFDGPAPTPAQMSTLRARPPGQLMSANEQCKLMFGQTSSFCNAPMLREQMCYRLWCRNPKDTTRCMTQGQLTAVYGTTCGDGKWCKHGECLQDGNAPPANNCQFGDEDPGYCSKKLRMDPRSCADDEFQQGCCETCERRG